MGVVRFDGDLKLGQWGNGSVRGAYVGLARVERFGKPGLGLACHPSWKSDQQSVPRMPYKVLSAT